MTTLLGVVLGCRRYDRLDVGARAALQQRRLRRLVRHARRHSRFYQERYKGLPDDPELTDLPPVTKAELMTDFERWVTDPSVTSAVLATYLADSGNIGRRLLGRYLVFTTSGSTGDPLVALYDRSANAVLGGVNTARGIARREDLVALARRGGTSVGVFAEGFYLSHASVRARQLAMPWKRDRFRVVSALRPLPEVVAELNRANPALLGGYSTILELLAEEQAAGRLRITPALVMAGGEALPEASRQRIEEVFGCRAQVSYACTEGGALAAECPERRLHTNDDWVVIEPVDADNRPVAPGTPSEKILITTLFNRTQPFLRYEVTDRVTLGEEPCPCGRTSPWLTVEGRSDDVATFTTATQEVVRITPLAIYATLNQTPGLARFQVVVETGNTVELRLDPAPGAVAEDVARTAVTSLRELLTAHRVAEPSIIVSHRAPQRQAGGGKFRHVITVPNRAGS